MELVDFLRQRLDEDEHFAMRTRSGEWTFDELGQLLADQGQTISKIANLGVASFGWHIARHDPARVLREVEAKRRIVDRYVGLRDRCEVAWSDYSNWLEGKPDAGNAPGVSSHDPAVRDELERVLRDLASAYAGHGDYRAEWAA